MTKEKLFCEQIANNDEKSKLCFNKKLRAISISGIINWQLAEEFFNVLRGFESLSSKEPLTIYINSEGGDVYVMFKIYDHIRNSPLYIITVVAGCASSAGFIVFLAGDLRKAFPHAFLGFHAPTVYFTNNANENPAEAKESAFHQNQILDAMVKIVEDNSNMSEKKIRKYFNILTRINVKIALKLGLVNEVINPLKKVPPKSKSYR